MTAIGIVGSAGALGGDHGGAERMLRSALLSERGTVVRFLDAPEHLATDTDRRLLGIDFLDTENALGVVTD
jgi:hypothetical protein